MLWLNTSWDGRQEDGRTEVCCVTARGGDRHRQKPKCRLQTGVAQDWSSDGIFGFRKLRDSWDSPPFSGNPNVRCLVTFVINTAVTCDVTPRCWVNVYRRYEWTCCFHYQCRSDSSTHIMKRVRSLQLYSASPTRRHFPVNQCIRVSFSAMSWNAYTSVCCLGCAECVIPYVNMAIEDTILLYYWYKNSGRKAHHASRFCEFELNLRKKLVKCNIWSIAIYGAETWTLRKVDQKYLAKFWNVMLEKDGEDQLDRSCEKWGIITQSQGGEEYPTYNT